MSHSDKFGSFEILREIGRGAEGVVYLAWDPELDREVALKTLGDDWAEDSIWLDRLAGEARVLGRFNHPHIAQIYSLETVDSERFLVLEYVPGQSLAQHLRGRHLPVRESLQICAQIADGLRAAHNRRVVHRDLKPANVRVSPELMVKIIDFGLAVARPIPQLGTTSNGSSAASTHRGEMANADRTVMTPRVVGTPGYMSPEQATGRPTDKRTDIFSFGCVLFECLAGRPAFPGPTVSARISAVLTDDPDWDSLPPDIPDSVTSVLGGCLAKNLGERLRDVGTAQQVIVGELEQLGESATLDNRTTPPNNLPRMLTSFVGRDVALARLRSTLSEIRLLTLHGAGGCGKTRLAIEVAELALADYPDGVWLAELAAVTGAAHVQSTVANVLSMDTSAIAGPLERLIERIGSRQLLLILDNCEHLVAACRELVDRMLRTCANMRVLVTSREPLGLPGEIVFTVPSLALPGLEEQPDTDELSQYESVQLFVDRARIARPEFRVTGENLLRVARICRQLDGIPLAIELAAARLKLLSLQQVEARLEDRFRLLTSGNPLAIERHRTLQATVDWSYELLSEAERLMLRRLSVCAGTFTLEIATALCAGERDEYEVLDLVTRLLEKSLILREDETSDDGEAMRYRMLDTIRRYAQERLSRAESVETRDRHLGYFLRLAESVTDDPTAVGLQSERENLMEALRWSMAGDDGTERDLRLAEVLRKLGM